MRVPPPLLGVAAIGFSVGLAAPAHAQPAGDSRPEVAEPGEDEEAGDDVFGDDFDELEEDLVEDSPSEATEAAGDEVEASDDEFDIDIEDDEGDFSIDGLLEDIPELKITLGGRIQSDLRFRLNEQSVGDWYSRRSVPQGIARNENILGLNFQADYGDITGRADVDFAVYGYQWDVDDIRDLSRRERLDPVRFDIHRLYVQMRDLVFDGFDLTVGNQLVYWGVGDQFNPTNNVNSDDIEDILLFGDQQGNFMVKADYWINGSWQINGVMIPIHRQALLPRSGPLALANLSRLPIRDPFLRRRLAVEQATSSVVGYPTVVSAVTPVAPERDMSNIQWGYRIAGEIGGQDVSVSYYRGRTDFPVPFLNRTTQSFVPQCNPDNPTDCINGTLDTQVFLHYPRMSVYGFNMAGEIGWLAELSEVFNAIGYRMEVALVAPNRSEYTIENTDLDLGALVQPAGEYDYDNDGIPGGRRPEAIEARPFPKWTIGLDYTFNDWLYANVQWVHGLADEYGAGSWIQKGDVLREVTINDPNAALQCALQGDGTTCVREVLRPSIGDYLVTGIDFTALEQQLLLRLFTIIDLSGVWIADWDPTANARTRDYFHAFTEEGYGVVLYPEANYNFGNGFDLGAGALIQLGPSYGKFGSPEAGGSLVWTRTRFAF